MRRNGLLVALACLIILFAGCTSANPNATDGAKAPAKGGRAGGAAAPALAPQTFIATLPDGSLADPTLLAGITPLKGEQRFIGAGTFEPTLGIDKKGNIYMVAFSGGARIRASFDQGVTWKQVNPVLPTGQNNPPNSNDPFVWVDKETGRIFTNDLQALMCSWMNWSDDEGKTWTSNPVGCGHPFGVHDHQSIATGKSRGTPSTWSNRVVYYCVNRVGDSACSASYNGGLTFGPLIPVMPGVDVERAGFCGGLTGHVKTDNAGRVFWGKSQCSVPSVGISEDDGKTWKVVVVSRAVNVRGHDVETAADEKDNLYAYWISDNGLPYLSMSTDHGNKWSTPMKVSPPGITATKFPAIWAAGEGKVAFTYMGTNAPKGFSTAGEEWDGVAWHAYIGVINNALDEKPITLTTMVDSASDPVAVGSCADRCNGMGDFMDINIDPNGRPWAALVDVCTDQCVKDWQVDPKKARNDRSQGFVGTLTTGPSLLTAGGALPDLPSMAPAA